jgi:hypothetical protein
MLVTEASPMERQERRVWFIRQAVSVSVESNISDASKWCIGALGTVGWNKCNWSCSTVTVTNFTAAEVAFERKRDQ